MPRHRFFRKNMTFQEGMAVVRSIHPCDYSSGILKEVNHLDRVREAVSGTCVVATVIEQLLLLAKSNTSPIRHYAYWLASQHLIQGCQLDHFRWLIAGAMLFPGTD